MTELEKTDKVITFFMSSLPFPLISEKFVNIFAASVIFTIKISERLFFRKLLLKLIC